MLVFYLEGAVNNNRINSQGQWCKYELTPFNDIITVMSLMRIDRGGLRQPCVTFIQSLGWKWQCEVCDSPQPLCPASSTDPLPQIDWRPGSVFPRLVTPRYWQPHLEKLTGHIIQTANSHFTRQWAQTRTRCPTTLTGLQFGLKAKKANSKTPEAF